MNKDKIFLSWLSPLKFVLTCLIVYIHSYNAQNYGLIYNLGIHSSTLWIEDIVSQNLAHIAVPLFFAISGYLYFRTLTFANLKEKLKRRVSSLCVPFIIWNAIYFLLFYIITHVPMIADTLNSTAVVEFDYKSLVGALFFYKQNYIMWFVYQLILYVFFLGPCLLLILKNIYVSLLTILILAVVYSIGYLELPNLSENTMMIGIYPDMLAYFIFGGFLSIYEIIPPSKLDRKKAKIIALLCFIVSQVIWSFNHAEYKDWYLYSLNFLFNIISICSILFFISSFSDKHKSNINIFDYSFFIFAIHPFLLECVQKAFYINLTHSEWVALIDYILSPMITICICVVIGKLIRKMSYLLYKILGGR